MIISEFAKAGETLADLLEKGEGLPWSIRLRAAASVASGLRYLQKVSKGRACHTDRRIHPLQHYVFVGLLILHRCMYLT